MKYKFISKSLISLALILFALANFSCQTNSPAKVVTAKQEAARNEDGVYYISLQAKNTGQNPAYFVVALVDAYCDGSKTDHIEASFGDIYPNGTSTRNIYLPGLQRRNPDKIDIQYTYTLTDNGMMP